MDTIEQYLKTAVEHGASDIFIGAGDCVSTKINGRINRIVKVNEEFRFIARIDGQYHFYSDGDSEGEISFAEAKDLIFHNKLMPDQTRELIRQCYEKARRLERFSQFNPPADDDFSFAVGGLARFRVNTYFQRASMAAVLRVVPFEIPKYYMMGIPDMSPPEADRLAMQESRAPRLPENVDIMELSKLKSGLLLVTGTTGSGKSTTLACILDRINHTRQCHIVTLEDPIEYLYRNEQSIVSQREIAIDTRDYAVALRACMRQAPDVILIGEMRDAETIQTAMTAAETGHLVFATLHTNSAKETINRLVDSFPAEQQGQIRKQITSVLKAVISQELLPRKGGGRIPAFEIMHMDTPIATWISKANQQENLYNSFSRVNKDITMDEYVKRLHACGEIDDAVYQQHIARSAEAGAPVVVPNASPSAQAAEAPNPVRSEEPSGGERTPDVNEPVKREAKRSGGLFGKLH